MSNEYERDLKVLTPARIQFQEIMIRHSHWQCCLNCDRFNIQKEVCEKFGGQRPPARIIVVGCPEFVDDIPF